MTMRVEVAPHDPKWRDEFEVEAERISLALAGNLVAIHHIGSTAIPGIYAKPIVDFLVEVEDLAPLDGHSSEMEALGYEAMGEFGISGRRYFRKEGTEGARTHDVHAFGADSGELERHLAFRDYLIAHPSDAMEYSDLKRRLAREYPYDIEGYMDGKDAFIKEMEARALDWRKSHRGE